MHCPDESGYAFVLKLTDHPGGMEVIAATFAHRGVSLACSLGNDGALDPEGRATVIVDVLRDPGEKGNPASRTRPVVAGAFARGISVTLATSTENCRLPGGGTDRARRPAADAVGRNFAGRSRRRNDLLARGSARSSGRVPEKHPRKQPPARRHNDGHRALIAIMPPRWPMQHRAAGASKHRVGTCLRRVPNLVWINVLGHWAFLPEIIGFHRRRVPTRCLDSPAARR